MPLLDRLLPDFPADRRGDRARLLGLMGMFFLVVTAVGILKPVKNALALSGLGDQEFYKVYLVSAVVVLFVPVYNRLSDRIGWRRLVPAVALFFGLNLVIFRLVYSEGSTLLGLTFYGWYDLFAAALVTQFFAATQMFLTARTARSAYPLVIAGGALGAVLGGGIAALLAGVIGTPNLLLVAAAFILAFSAGITLVWPEDLPPEFDAGKRVRRRSPRKSEVRRVFGNGHVRLIAVSVLVTILVKQLVDYQFNTLTERIFVTEDAITEFQGTVNAAIQGLPLLSVLLLRPLLRRWGVGAAVFLLPVLMLVTGLGMVAFFGIWAVIAVRAADTTFRYSADRAGREILYVPVPNDIKLKAKTYIDVGIEKGLGKAVSAGLIFLLVEALGVGLHGMAYIVVALTLAWLTLTVAIRREYVRTLARSIRGRVASFQGLSALSDASTQGVVRQALDGRDPVETSFALDLVDQSAATDTRGIAPALNALLEHDSAEIRRKALDILSQDPTFLDLPLARRCLEDRSPDVREAAVRGLVLAHPEAEREALLRELLRSDSAGVRTAVLSCLTRRALPGLDPEALGEAYLEEHWDRAVLGDRTARIELALAAGALRADHAAGDVLEPLLGDPDPAVASAALRSAGLLERPELHPAMIAALRAPATREPAREALAQQGDTAVDALGEVLMDERAHPAIRQLVPTVLARIPTQRSADALLYSIVATETDQLLDYRSLKALSRLRASHPELTFDRDEVLRCVAREVTVAERYDRARRCLRHTAATGPSDRLLGRALEEAWQERQEGVFRLLGLLHAPDAMHRCHMALSGADRNARGNALEWLEETIERALLERIRPMLEEHTPTDAILTPQRALEPLVHDEDPWIARLAVAAVGERAGPWRDRLLRAIIEGGFAPQLSDLARRLIRGFPLDGTGHRPMDLIEKVFLLQKIDLLQDARSAHLALLASIAEDIDADAGAILIRRDEPTDALYVVVDGRVDLDGVGDQRVEAGPGMAFGTWALIDAAPSVVTAVVGEDARLLRITRSDFHDLLTDHSELALGLLQGLARRVRTLVA